MRYTKKDVVRALNHLNQVSGKEYFLDQLTNGTYRICEMKNGHQEYPFGYIIRGSRDMCQFLVSVKDHVEYEKKYQ